MWIIFAKEFQDIVRNRRRFIWMLVSSLIVFPILFVVPYALILGRLTKQSVAMISVPAQGMDNAPSLVAYLKESDIELFAAENVEALVLSKQYPVGLIIPDDYQTQLDNDLSAEVELVADLRRSVDFTSSRLTLALSDYADVLATERMQTRGVTEEYLHPLIVKQQNAATAEETTGSMLSLLIPGVIISLSLTAGMPVAVSTIAGEKKKLTLEPMLFTTVNRFQVVLAKLLAVLASVFFSLILMAFSVIVSGVVLGLVILRSLPKDLSALTNTTAPTTSSPLTESITGYTINPTAILLFLIAPLLIILFSAALQILISAWARNDEEANTYLAPLNFVSVLVVFMAFFLDEFTPQLWHYGLPVFGTILSMRDLLSNNIDPASLAVMFISSALYAALMLSLAVWMFSREEIVFRT
jgi:sodium transport system permease protein